MPDTGGSGRLACERCLAFLGPSDLHASVHAADTPLSDAESWCVTDQRIVPCGCGVLYCCRKVGPSLSLSPSPSPSPYHQVGPSLA